jgi:hypothetical protein
MPDLKLVSERSIAEMRQQASTRELKAALIGLTANLIRIVRGAGAPDRLLEQVRNFAEAYASFVDVHGRDAHPHLFNELLPFGHPEELPEDDDYAMRVLSDYEICQSALQVVASSLLQQRPQLDKAWSDLHRLLDTREERRARRKKVRSGGRSQERIRESTKEAMRLTSRQRERRDMYGIEPKVDPKK